MKELKDLTLQEYEGLKKTGFLWEFYPEATGDVDEDLDAVCVKLISVDGIERTKYKTHSKITETSIRRFFYDIIDEEAEYDW